MPCQLCKGRLRRVRGAFVLENGVKLRKLKCVKCNTYYGA